jgi:hypothetical protein
MSEEFEEAEHSEEAMEDMEALLVGVFVGEDGDEAGDGEDDGEDDDGEDVDEAAPPPPPPPPSAAAVAAPSPEEPPAGDLVIAESLFGGIATQKRVNLTLVEKESINHNTRRFRFALQVTSVHQSLNHCPTRTCPALGMSITTRTAPTAASRCTHCRFALQAPAQLFGLATGKHVQFSIQDPRTGKMVRCVALRCVALRCVALRCVASRRVGSRRSAGEQEVP